LQLIRRFADMAVDDFANACCGVLRELSAYLGYDYTYRAFQPGFVDEDVVQPQSAAQPEPSAAQFIGTADWWRAAPRATQTTSAPKTYASFMVLFLGFPGEKAQTNARRAARTMLPSQRHDFLERWLAGLGLNRPMRL
jgi:hypothetical protein